MRVALFTDTYTPDVNGVARTLARLVRHGSARGHDFALVTPSASEAPDPVAWGHHRLSGAPVPVYPELPLARPLDRTAKRMLRDFRPELVHVATEANVGFFGRHWARVRGLPVVTSFHTNFPAYLHDYHLGWLESLVWRYLRWFHRCSLVTLCPSRDTLQQLRAQGFHGRMRVWSRGVDTQLYSPARRRAHVRARIAPGAERILLYVGRLAAEKRVAFLLDAFELVRERTGPDVALVFVGDGPVADKLRRRAPDGVYFTGYLTGVPLAEAYAAGDIFVFASHTETFGNVVLEALASGLPAIVVDKGGVRETVHSGRTGLRVPVGDVVAFATACVELLNDARLRAELAKGARTEALSRSWESILDGVLHEYATAVSCTRTDAPLRVLEGGGRR